MSKGDGSSKISSRDFYETYSGHKVSHLKNLLPVLRASSDRIIWTAGDSSLDNKYWFDDTAAAVGPYKDVLSPPRSKQDITYWMNYLCENEAKYSQQNMVAINTAVEATTLNERTFRLRSQDIFVRNNMKPNDILIVSVGGNDVALFPCPCTIASICGLLCLPTSCVEKGFAFGQVPIDDYCCGCGPSLCSCACACPPCLGYFRHLFGTRIQKYVEALTSKVKPAKILICMIYYPDEHNTGGWASPALGALGYNSKPAKLQLLIRKAYQDAVTSIRIPGTQVVPVPLFHVLDGKVSEDYIQRVEPSPSGGRKMAEFLLDMVDQQFMTPNDISSNTASMAPSAPYMQDRE